jgi:hypothetical protein
MIFFSSVLFACCALQESSSASNAFLVFLKGRGFGRAEISITKITFVIPTEAEPQRRRSRGTCCLLPSGAQAERAAALQSAEELRFWAAQRF